MKELKKEMNEIIIEITEELLKQNIKNTEERIMNNTINNNWVDEKEIEMEAIEKGNFKNTHKIINEVINLMREREELYEVRMVYELQQQTKKIEEMKKQLERILYYEAHIKNSGDLNLIIELANVIDWIEEEQEKYRL